MQRAVLIGVAAGFIAGTAAVTAQQRQSGPSTSVTVRAISPESITGLWDYNDALSVDAATGRPERAPRSATQRPVAAPPQTGSAAGGARPGSLPGGAGGGGGGRTDGFDQARRAMAAIIAAERRTYVRDLLEVPEQLTIKASAGEVTFVDDLSRERSFPTDGRLQRYQLSAARFEARATWAETYFRKDIEGSNNFKMSETYFVSDDGSRLFVIIRIGDPKKPETLAGVNRVYDRVRPGLAR